MPGQACITEPAGGLGEESLRCYATPLKDSAERALWGEEAATVARCGEGPTADRSRHDSPAILRTQHGPNTRTVQCKSGFGSIALTAGT